MTTITIEQLEEMLWDGQLDEWLDSGEQEDRSEPDAE